MTTERSLVVRPLADDELAGCRELEQQAFGFSEADAIPAHVRLTTNLEGGLTLGAFAAGELVGFSYAFPSHAGTGRRALYSLGLVVRRDMWATGIGRSLKHAQRQEARQRGYDLIRWSIGSLNSRSLHVCLTHLGAVLTSMRPGMLDRVLPDVYMDEVLCEWRIAEESAAGPSTVGLDDVAGLAVTRSAPMVDGLRAFGDRVPPPDDWACPTLLVEVPWDHGGLRAARPDLLPDWRGGVTGAMVDLFESGYEGRSVLLDHHERRAFVVFSRSGVSRPLASMAAAEATSAARPAPSSAAR
jgi:predicted GNAT superfamily acetyltransferase